MKSFKTINGEYAFELTEKRSKFIATLCHVESEEQATEIINKIRSKYWDAKHNVYAYSLNEGNLTRFSDDNEPHGTAGKPVLDVIEGNGLKNVLIVVTRYFGGVLLGTGGLVRAYSGAAAGAVNSAVIAYMTPCCVLSLQCDYGMYDLLNKLCENIKGGVISTDFNEQVVTKIYISADEYNNFLDLINNTFNGKILINIIENKYYPI